MRNTLLAVIVLFFLLLTTIVSSAAAAAPVFRPRPETKQWGTFTLCSENQPLCVHARDAHADLSGALEELDDVASALTARGWPRPRVDMGLGGSNAFDVYLDDSSWTTPPWSRVFGQTYPDSSFLSVGGTGVSAWAAVHTHLPAACLRRSVLAKVYFRAVLYAMDALSSDALAQASSAYVASILAPCSISTLASVQDLQGLPHLGIASNRIVDPQGGLMFPAFLERSRSSSSPLDLLRATWTLAEDYPSDLASASNKISWLSIIPYTTSKKFISPGQTWLQFAVERVFPRERTDLYQLPRSQVTREPNNVKLSWYLPFGSLPSRVLIDPPVRPTGSCYTFVDLSSAPKGSRLIFHAEWEPSAVFRFALIFVDHHGVPLRSKYPPTVARTPHLSSVIDDISRFAGLFVVAANVGYAKSPAVFDSAEVAADPGAGLAMTFYRK